MRRRDFIKATAAVTTAWPLAARAQQPARMRRVGVLLPFDENDPEVINRVKQFRLGMRDLDWIEGRSVLIDFRFTGANSESISRGVTELIKTAPEVIVSYATPGLSAVRRATSTIPIVFVNVTDPGAISRGSHSSSQKWSGNGSTCLATLSPDYRGPH